MYLVLEYQVYSILLRGTAFEQRRRLSMTGKVVATHDTETQIHRYSIELGEWLVVTLHKHDAWVQTRALHTTCSKSFTSKTLKFLIFRAAFSFLKIINKGFYKLIICWTLSFKLTEVVEYNNLLDTYFLLMGLSFREIKVWIFCSDVEMLVTMWITLTIFISFASNLISVDLWGKLNVHLSMNFWNLK